MPGEWLTVDEVASRYKVPKKTVYKWNSDGTGPEFLRIGKHVRYSFDALRRWEAAHMATQQAA